CRAASSASAIRTAILRSSATGAMPSTRPGSPGWRRSARPGSSRDPLRHHHTPLNPTREAAMTRRTLGSLLCLTLAFAAGPARAQDASPASGDEAAIRALEERVRLGVLARDTAALREIWAPTFAVNAPANRVAPNRAAVFGLLTQGFIH